AVRAQGAWAISPVAATPDNDQVPDTDGTWVVYERYTGSSYGIYFQNLAGGPEMRLVMPGYQYQRAPRISRGVITFMSGSSDSTSDLYAYDIGTNLLYQVTSTPAYEILPDISVLDNGDARVVWAAEDHL